MADVTADLDRQLVQSALARRAPVNLGALPPGGAPTPVSPAPQAPPAAAPTPAAPPMGRPLRATDDPSLLEQAKPFQQSIDNATAGLEAERQRASGLQDELSQVHVPNYKQDYEPHGWRKALGIGLGMIPLAPAQLGSAELMHVPQYRRAVADYGRQRQSVMDQVEAERGLAVPLAEAEQRMTQEGYRNFMDLRREQREQTAFENEPTGKLPYQDVGADGKTHWYQDTKGGRRIEVAEPREITENRRKEEEDKETPAPGARPEPDPAAKGKWRVRTKAGGYIPYTPKSIDEAAMMGDPTATRLFNQEHFHEGANGATPGGWTPAQSREITQRQRPILGQIKREEDKLSKLELMGPESGDDGKKAYDSQVQEITERLHGKDGKSGLYGQLTDIENDVAKREPSPSATAFSVPKGAPKPTKPGDYLKDKGKAIAYSADGRNWGPLPDRKASQSGQ